MTADPPATARWEHREAFWTLVVGAPAGLSVLRLWVESGGRRSFRALRTEGFTALTEGLHRP